MSDIENAGIYIDGLTKIKVLKPAMEGLLELKWRETRVMFGQETAEEMWVTEVEEVKSYQTRSESHGYIYLSKHNLE